MHKVIFVFCSEMRTRVSLFLQETHCMGVILILGNLRETTRHVLGLFEDLKVDYWLEVSFVAEIL